MLIFFVKSQLPLFDTPVPVAAHVRKDGVFIPRHIRIQKVTVKQPSLFDDQPSIEPPKRTNRKKTKLDIFLARYGGAAGMARILPTFTEAQQKALIAKMAEAGNITPEAVAEMLADGKKEEPKQVDLFAQPVDEPKAAPSLVMPDFQEGKTTTGVKEYYEKVAQQIIDMAAAGDAAGLEAIKAKGMKPSAKTGKIPNTWAGKTANSKLILALHAQALAMAGGKPAAAALVEEKKQIKRQSLPEGWSGRVNGLATNDDPVSGGIVDANENLGWFVIPIDTALDGKLKDKFFPTQSDAFAALNAAVLDAKKPAPVPAPAITHDPAAPFGVKAGTSKTKRRDINSAVVARLATGGPYTADDLALFRQYSGNGGCGDSLNEFYTDPAVARGMWSALRTMGFEHGTALEPSCATGVFLHTAPEGVRVTGVELDPTSAGAALALHGDRHEIITASLERFATTDDRQFDVVIGNPPYGPRGFLAKDDKVDISTAEQYFTDTALDKCKPGGIVALVVPTGIMDSKSARSFRENMLRKGEFLGAQRMPNSAFEHSHTEVTTDVIYLRKRGDDVAGALGTVDQETLKKLGVWDDEFLAGEYFTGRGADNVLGTMTEGWRAKAGMGNDITVEGSMQGVPEAIASFVPESGHAPVTMQHVLDSIDGEKAKDRAVSAGFRRPYANTAKVGDTKVVDGKTYVLQGDPPRWHAVDEFMQTDSIADAQDIANDIGHLINGTAAIDRPALEERVRAYVEKHGIPVNDANLMTAANVDKSLYNLIGAVDRKGNLSDAVLGKAARKIEASFDTAAQVLALEHTGGFTSTELAGRLNKEADEVIDQLAADPHYAYLGGGKWTTMDAYLTGELWPKLDAAKAALDGNVEPDLAEKRRLQIDRLEKTIDAKSLEDADFQMNSAWVPMDVLAAFFNWKNFDSEDANEWTRKLDPVEINFEGALYSVKGGNSWGDTKLLEKYLNRKGVRKEDDLPRIEKLNDEFKEWLCASQYRDRVEELYNRSFRGFVTPEFSNEPMDIPGLNPDRTVRDWRWSSLRRSLADGKGIIADDVGLGKTLGGLLLARMAKVNGQAKRPIIVVPKSVLANWFEEAETWFPGSRVLTIGGNFTRGKDGQLIGSNDGPSERKRKYHDLKQNDYDFIIISVPVFQELDLDPITKEQYYSQDFWVQRGEALGNAGDKRRKKIKENYEQALAQREIKNRTDATYFNELGVDMLIADEMHHQKNLYAAKDRFSKQPKFLGGTGLSDRSLDFNLKTRWVRENNGGKNVYGLTATPTKNSPLEIYSMLSHIAPEAFERIGIRNSEEFLDRFCEFVQDKVLGTKGDIEDATVVSGFKNLDELREIMGRFIDRRTAVDVGLKLPERNDHMHLVEMTPAQQEVYAELRELAAESAGKKDATGDAHVFSIMSKMGKAALDLSLLDENKYAGAESPKYKALAKQCKEKSKDGGQIIFCEALDSYDRIISALVDSGFKRNEIGVITGDAAKTAVQRQNIANDFNDGKLKVLVGNVVMSEGLNLQKTTTDIHHMDVPWEPATLQQRNGRGLRQGNMNERIRIHTYLSKGSFDGYRYQAVAAKKDWQDLLWNGGDRVDNLAREGKISAEEMRIMLAADPEAARKVYEADKEAAQTRYDADQRTEAQKVFVKFREMARSYGELKNKNTASGERLRQKMESIKTSLFRNKYWPAKEALNNSDDVLIHPQTGAALVKDVGLTFPDEGKMVVTGVNMKAGTVTMRRYANTKGGLVTLPIKELNDAKPFAFDAGAEAEEVGKAFEEQANAKLNNLTSWDDIKAMPSAVLEKNHDLIQKQIKEGAKSYKFNMPYGSIPMVNRETGELKMAESYEHNRLHDTHDYLLPTDAAKEKAIQAWMDSERNKKFGQTTFRARKNARTEWRNQTEYPDASYSQKARNPWTSLLTEMSGDRPPGISEAPIVRETRKRFLAEQLDRVRRAATFNDALAAAFPTAQLPEYSATNKPVWSSEVVSALWDRASKDGLLDTPMDDYVPKRTIGSSKQLFPVHDKYATHRGGYVGEDGSVRGTLQAIAAGSGHKELAETMKKPGAPKKEAA